MRDPGGPIRTRVGRAIRRLRLVRRFSQERLAELAGTSFKHIGQIERGEVNVTVDILARVARGLSTDVADLFPRPPGRQRSRTALELIMREDVDEIIAIGERAKELRAVRSPRTSR
jgi:transcriptional regulator with XRE-family HTH domain